LPVDDPSDGCTGCASAPPPQAATIIWGEHDGVLRTAILALKHGGRDDLARPLAQRLCAKVAAQYWADEIDGVCDVPSHPLHRGRRPWTAARLMADASGSLLGRRVVHPLRRRGLRRQTGHRRATRLALPQRSFQAAPSARGRRLLLIDDVTTTGATLWTAAAALLDAGAETVYCAALAHTPDPRRSP
jgi:predicted amidophosphoribosyltransferase